MKEIAGDTSSDDDKPINKKQDSIADSSSKELPPVKTSKKPSPPKKGVNEPVEESYS